MLYMCVSISFLNVVCERTNSKRVVCEYVCCIFVCVHEFYMVCVRVLFLYILSASI